LSKCIQENMQEIKRALGEPDDLKVRSFTFDGTDITCIVIYIDGIVQEQSIQEGVLQNLQQATALPNEANTLFHYIWKKQIAINHVEKVSLKQELLTALLVGQTIILIDGVQHALTIATTGGEH